MSISYRVLGESGHDNAMIIRIDTGHNNYRLLFDCGDSCITPLKHSDILNIDHLFFSHFHMDHIGGFDLYFRYTFDRLLKKNIIWGPPGTIDIFHHRFQSFLWNFFRDHAASWYVREIHPGYVKCARFELSESFTKRHDEETIETEGLIVMHEDFTVRAIQLNHSTPSMGYIVREMDRLHVDTSLLEDMGISEGPWIGFLKKDLPDNFKITVNEKRYTLGDLRDLLMTYIPGDSIAYLTDFRIDPSAEERLVNALIPCKTIVCESKYTPEDLDLAIRNYHMTSAQTAGIAKKAGAEKLILIHISDRYDYQARQKLLAHARRIFPQTFFPDHWKKMPHIKLERL